MNEFAFEMTKTTRPWIDSHINGTSQYLTLAIYSSSKVISKEQHEAYSDLTLLKTLRLCEIIKIQKGTSLEKVVS